MPAATAARKRKQTEDMEVSPPKRVTRARSAKAHEAPAAPASKPARATKATAASKASEKAKLATKSTRSAAVTKRTTRARDSEEPNPAEDMEEESAKPTEPPKTRGRPKKAEITAAETAKSTVAKTRTRTTKAASSKAAPTATRTRARAASIADESEDELMEDVSQAHDEIEKEIVSAPKKTTRSRAAVVSKSSATSIKITAPSTRAAATSRATGATASTTARNTAAKKQVAFVEEIQDKENVPVRGRASNKTKSEDKPSTTGIRGRPVRKTAASSTTASTRATGPKKAAPLSPKKVNQVAKGNSSSDSEDELGSKSPVGVLAKSPMKPPQSVRKELPFIDTSVPSPTKLDGKQPSSPLLNRSPMRPPQSTRKDLPFASVSVSSPSKAFYPPQGEGLGRQPSLAASLLMSPAKRPPTSPSKSMASNEPSAPAHSGSHLLASPAKRLRLDVSKVAQSQSQPEAPLKQSLLQSPARRPQLPLGSMTAVPKEKRPSYLFGNDNRGGQDLQVFNFSAATPRRLFASKGPAEELSNQGSEDEGKGDAEHEDELDQDFPDVDTESCLSAGIADLDFDDTVAISPSGAGRGRTVGGEAETSGQDGVGSTTPPGLPADSLRGQVSTSKINRALFRDQDHEDSDDGLSATSSFRASNNSIATPTPVLKSKAGHLSKQQASPSLGMTPLAHQFDNWLAESGSAATTNITETSLNSTPFAADTRPSPAKASYFEDEMLVRDSVEEPAHYEARAEPFQATELPEYETEVDLSAISSGSQSEYGDENAMPVDPQLLDFTVPMKGDFSMAMEVDSDPATADPLELNMTPTHAVRRPPREVRTVSKVPLKEADERSPAKTFRRKAKSLAPGALADMTDADLGDIDSTQLVNEPTFSPGPVPSIAITPVRSSKRRVSSFGTPAMEDSLIRMATPFKTPRIGADAQILRGAVVFVDVHTTEGADASGLFVELLTQMGARCIKQWNWNPKSGNTETPGGSKVGITHVVYKDGGKRTLEKVREAKGLVSCVGVGWVLDCERENKWVEEAEYVVDTSFVPRGGYNRRKSMEPQALENINGTLRPASGSSQRSVSTPNLNMSPTKEFLTFSNTGSPVDADAPVFDAPTPTMNFGAANMTLPETPAVLKGQSWEYDNESDDLSKTPTTPYFMSKGAQLVQATCPPKQQTGRMLFPVSGRIEDEPDEDIRRRLVLARRKSLQWAPKIGSPLRRE